ncbi:MAG: hypothetical protein SFT91_01860 [Rickettsiaceae bacterium]|nr:hypothetical protein [Rickettsiaceae bacterium]
MIRIVISKFFSNTSQLWGATPGDRLWREVLRNVSVNVGTPNLVLYDFSEVEAVNASFLKASVLPCYRDIGLLDNNVVFPIVCNLNNEVEDEFLELLTSRKLAISQLDNKITILGNIETMLMDTLELLNSLDSSSAPELYKNFDSKIGVTGWNNRLNELYNLRLVSRKKFGRTWIYKSIAKEVV